MPRIQVSAVRVDSRAEDYSPTGYYGLFFSAYDPTKACWMRFRVTGASPATLSVNAWEDNGADTSAGDTSVAHGANMLTWSTVHDNTDAAISYLQRVGVAGFIPISPGDFNSGTGNDSKIAAVRFAVQSAIPALTSPIPTLTSRTSTLNNLLAAPTGGVDPKTVEWYTLPNDPSLPAITGNKITGATTLSLAHTHGDAAGTLRFYRYKATDAATPSAAVATSAVLMVEAQRPAPAALPALRDDLLAGRKVIYATWGDSITAGGGIQTQAVADFAAQGITNVTVLNLGQQGSALTEDTGWSPTAPNPYPGNNWSTTNNLYTNAVNLITAAMAANPGAFLVISGMILTNDAQRYNSGITNNLVQTTFEAIFAGFAAAFPTAIQIINGEPYSFGGTISADAHVAEIGWRAATVSAVGTAQGAGRKVVLGDRAGYYASYVNASTWFTGDPIHPNATGQIGLGHLWADSVLRYVLVDTQAPVISSAAVAANGTTITFTFDQLSVGNLGLTVRVGGVNRSLTIPTRTTPALTAVGTLASPVLQNEVVDYSYDPTPGNITDASLNELAAITNQTVFNGSTQTSVPSSSITSLIVSPSSKTVYPGGYAVLTATVAGTGTFDPSKTWSKVVSGDPIVIGSLSDGTEAVFVPANTPIGPYQVRATSVQDGTKSALCTITVQALPSGGGGGPDRPVWAPATVEFVFSIVESCRRIDVDGDEPLLIQVVASLLTGQYLPVTDFDPEISVTADGSGDWQAATWAPGARAALAVTGSEADTPLVAGSYVVRLRLKNADGVVLRSDRIGIIDVS